LIQFGKILWPVAVMRFDAKQQMATVAPIKDIFPDS
jgi:hypothetical protein